MGKKSVFTRALTIAGTVLVLIPLFVPFVFSIIGLIALQEFRFDYLTPMELSPLALVGGGLLIWAALRAQSLVKWIGWSLGTVIGLLFGSQGFAVVTGMASGETEPVGWQWAILIATIIAYGLAVIALGVGGVLLSRKLFKRSGKSV